MHDELTGRRLIERLSGWRLFGFLAIAFVNLLVLLALSLVAFDLSPATCRLVTAVITAQVSLFAVSVGAFRFPFAVKISLVATAVLWSLWALSRVSPQGGLGSDVANGFFEFSIQSSLLLLASTFFWWWRDRRVVTSFGARDLFVVLSAAAILFPVSLTILDWSAVAKLGSSLFKLSGIAMANSLWCIIVLCIYVKGILPRRRYAPADQPREHSYMMRVFSNRYIWWAFVAGLLVAIELWFYLNYLVPRIVYLAWLVVSMVPVVGLSADSGSSVLIPPNINKSLSA